MNVTDVLTLMNTESLKGEQGQGRDTSLLQGDLFAQLLNSLTGMQTIATGQISEEQRDDNLKLETEGLDLLKQQSTSGDIFGLNAYLQILQNVFPAGKEANSGLMGEMSLNGLQKEVAAPTETIGYVPIGEIKQSIGNPHLHVSLVQMVEQPPFNMKTLQPMMNQVSQNQSNTGKQTQALSQMNFGLEGIISPKSGEIQSLNSKELDQYIETFKQLQELSGQIEVKKDQSQRPHSGEISGNINGFTLTANHNYKSDRMTNVITNANFSGNPELVGQEKLNLAAAVPNEDATTNSSGSDQNRHQAHAGNSEIQPIQITSGRTETTHHSENVITSNVKIPEVGRAWEQVLDVIKKQDLSAKEVKELSIRLQPADLGRVNVSLRMENGQLHVMVNASEQATSVILQSHLQDLKNGLTQMGLACGQFQMSYGQNSDGRSAKDFNQDSRAYRYNPQEEEGPSFTAAMSSNYSAHGSGGRINVSA